MKHLALALVSLLALSACVDQTSTTSPPSQEEPASSLGGAAFRLASAELAALSVTSDSLRVEASREGRTISATGTLEKGVQVDGLSPGEWTFKVAAHDKQGVMQWYGEGRTKVVSGTTVDLLVTLRRASGSVHVGIVLDSGEAKPPLPSKDTLWPAVDTMIQRGDTRMPFLKAEVAGPYVAIRVVFNCNATKLRLVRTVDDTGVVHLQVVNSGPLTEMACVAMYSEQVIMYKPRSPRELILVEDYTGKSVFLVAKTGTTDPTIPANAEFKALDFVQGGGFTVDGASYKLSFSATGSYSILRSRSLCDSLACTRMIDSAFGTLTGSSLDSALRLFADTAIYRVAPLPTPEFSCADAPWWKAAVSYTDGHVATMAKPEEICSGLPAAYDKVSAFAWSLVARTPLFANR